MKAKLKFTMEEVAAMITANIAATWACPPGYEWRAEWRSFDTEVTVESLKIEPPKADSETEPAVPAKPYNPEEGQF